MKRWIAVGMAFSVLLLSACVATAPKLNANDSQAVGSAITVQRDDFKKMTNFKGPNASPDILQKLFLRAWKTDATGTISYQIYVMDYYRGDWRFYNEAYDSNGTSLDTTIISRNVDSCSRYGCWHEEHLGLNVTRDYLESHQASGIRFKVSGKAGENVFYIPSGYIKGFLLVVR